jgi:hypothetical protein
MDDDWHPNNKDIEFYELHKNMLSSLSDEIRELSRKKQEGVLNLTKVKIINRVLSPLKEGILSHLPSHIFLDILDETLLPSNSDAVLIISQYEASLGEFRNKFYITYEYGGFSTRSFWRTVENPNDNGRYTN